jgi:hypothetical protein
MTSRGRNSALGADNACLGSHQEEMCGCLGKPVTWSKFKINKIWSYLYQLKAYELRMKTQFNIMIISLFKPELQHVECRWSGHFL